MPFDFGETPTIAVFNQAVTPLGVEMDALITALQSYVDKWIAPVWHSPARLIKSTGLVKNAWAMVMLDDADQPGAEAYHELTSDGLPISKVFVRTTLANGDTVGASASHELAEALINPTCTMMFMGSYGELLAGEIADPVEEVTFKINGIPMSDFVFPAYFESARKPGSARFDVMARVTAPFQILHGGYQITYDGKNWSNVFGSDNKAQAFGREDRRGHRSEIIRNSIKEKP